MSIFKKKSKYIDDEDKGLSDFQKLVISILLIIGMLIFSFWITNKMEQKDIQMQGIEYVKESY